MDSDELFSNFKPNKEKNDKKEQKYMGKKRNPDSKLEESPMKENKRQKLEN